jgi:hypothetical protein
VPGIFLALRTEFFGQCLTFVVASQKGIDRFLQIVKRGNRFAVGSTVGNAEMVRILSCLSQVFLFSTLPPIFPLFLSFPLFPLISPPSQFLSRPSSVVKIF